MTKSFLKDLRRSIWVTKTRFISLILLMALGSFALVGLKVTSPDMARSANSYIRTHQMMDLAVVTSYGFSADDKEELKKVLHAEIVFGHLLDAEIGKNQESIRLFSNPKEISKLTLTDGRLPKNNHEIALASWQDQNYKIGQSITLTTPKDNLLKEKRLKIVGFVSASDIWSKENLGASQTGDGNLALYGFLSPSNFQMDDNIAKITFKDVKVLNAFSKDYKKKVQLKEEKIEKLIADNGEKRLSELKSDALAKFKEPEEKINKALSEIKTKEQSLKGLPPLPQVIESRKQISEAKAKLQADSKKLEGKKEEVNKLTKPTYQVYNRTTFPGGQGYQIYDTSMVSISQVGNIFPVVLYLVAALVTFTTMTRFVDEERINSGLYLALGFGPKDILKKFLIYGFLASFIGSTIGILGGTYFLSGMIAKIITLPLVIGKTNLDFYWSYAGIAYFLAALSALLPVYIIVRRELFQVPAQLLLPKPPSKGSKILLEKIPLIWKRLSFTQKVTARNIFRYKQRMLMTIFGVAGSVALLFSGLGIQSSLSKVVEHQFQDLTPFHVMVVGKAKDEETSLKLEKVLARDQAIENQEKVSFSTLHLDIKGQNSKMTTSIIASPKKSLSPLINLQDVSGEKSLSIPAQGVVISQKLAHFYQVKTGQDLTLRNEKNQEFKVKIVAITDMNVGHYLFMSEDYAKAKFGQLTYSPAYLLALKNGSLNHVKSFAKKMLNKDGVEAVSQNTVIIEMVTSIVSSLKQIMTLLVVLSLLLALVILYNLTAINIAERLRELSTIKVLGFFDKEVTLYIYRESILLSLIGIIIGFIGGKYLHQLLMSLMGSSDMNFGYQVDSYVYIIPVIAISFIVCFLALLVHGQLKHLDMLEALKSVD